MRFKLTHFEIINFEIEEIYEPLQLIKGMLDGVTLLPRLSPCSKGATMDERRA